MAHVYVLKSSKNRFYIGASDNLEQRLDFHNSGRVYSTKRLGLPLTLVASQYCDTMHQALALEKKYKSWKNAKKVIAHINTLSSPD